MHCFVIPSLRIVQKVHICAKKKEGRQPPKIGWRVKLDETAKPFGAGLNRKLV